MKTIVLASDIHEFEIKPQALLNEYRRLLAKDVQEHFLDPQRLTAYACPGCRSKDRKPAFKKFGMEYVECGVCGAIYVTPRPSEEDLIQFYRNSETSKFWREQIFPNTSATRREKIFRPQARWVLEVVDRYCPNIQLGIVLGYHSSQLIEELVQQEGSLFQVIVTTPTADIEFADKNFSNVTVKPTPIGGLSSLGFADIFLAFDILDRCADPDALFSAISETLTPGGLLLANTTLGSGFDLQVLWDRSESIFPPDRLNLLTVEGMTALFERHGFEAIEFSTPGRFDVEIVQRTINEDTDSDWPRFIQYLVKNRDQEALNAFQEYLQAYRLSSFARLVLRKQG